MPFRKSASPQKNLTVENDMLASFSPWHSVGKILPTSTKPKEDVFESFRPTKQCVEYTISETWTKMQGGDVKVNIKQTNATYEEIPPEICKPKRKKKLKLFSGGPPQWKFIDELWKEDMNEVQENLKVEHKKVLRDLKTIKTTKRKSDHERVQRLVGPEWFMELSPKQLRAIENLRESVYLDIGNQTTMNCADVLASLGLVLRPNQRHIAMALKHSCGCPIEFLLVLYQIIDPHRQRYSLNDRLLLSSVVHLSITQTLRELHVRIPSPPRRAKLSEHYPKKKIGKKEKYKSPYLEPLTYEPPPPRHEGIYKNKHKQYPESPYFSYIPLFEIEKRKHGFCFNYNMLQGSPKQKEKMREYNTAQGFYESLPGVKEQDLKLIPPTVLQLCPNYLNTAKSRPAVNVKFIPPHLCKVPILEPIICFCNENPCSSSKPQKPKISICEKSAQKFLQTLCLCDECLENVAQKNLIRIHGGFKKTLCSCDAPVPVIQGTVLNKTCDCYKDYRNKIVGYAAREFLLNYEKKFMIEGVVMTKFGPVYQIQSTRGKKICLCGEIKERNRQIDNIKETLLSNEAKYVIGGVTMSQFGPVYNLTSVVARAPCKCVLAYRKKLEILSMQNKIRVNPATFVNNGLAITKCGPLYHFSNVLAESVSKRPSEVYEVCSCEIKKPKCFNTCMDYLEYKAPSLHSTSSSECTSSDSSVQESGESTSELETDLNEPKCPNCGQSSWSSNKSEEVRKCQPISQTSSFSSSSSSDSSHSSDSKCLCTKTKSNLGSQQKQSACKKQNDDEEDYFAPPKPCSCKDELERFMSSKCPCEMCNRKLRQSYATYVHGGTKITSSGNQIDIVGGVHQPLCSCLHDHLEFIKKVDDYKKRLQARYELKKQPKKYCISGVTNTPDGPVYIISGIRPPVECECGKALREKHEQEEHERKRAKPPKTGRIKFEICGVKAMSKENIFILSRALNISPCECEYWLKKFEGAHKSCLEALDNYLNKTEEEKQILDGVREEKIQSEEKIEEDNVSNDDLNESTNLPQEEDVKDSEAEAKTSSYKEKSSSTELSQHENNNSTSDNLKSKNCSCADDSYNTESEESSDEESSSETTSSETSSSEDNGSCHIDLVPEVKPIRLKSDKPHPNFFLSKRFAIYKKFPRGEKKQMEILQHILKGMADDDWPLAKLPHVHKLPIFKLWLELRSGVYWTYTDREKYWHVSKILWRHTLVCYNLPHVEPMPFTGDQARAMTWKDAKLIRRIAAEKSNNFYRKLKHATIDAGREFFAPTFSYEFPTSTWRDCFFAYIPAKEEDVFPYKIVQPHDTREVPDAKKVHCYC